MEFCSCCCLHIGKDQENKSGQYVKLQQEDEIPENQKSLEVIKKTLDGHGSGDEDCVELISTSEGYGTLSCASSIVASVALSTLSVSSSHYGVSRDHINH